MFERQGGSDDTVDANSDGSGNGEEIRAVKVDDDRAIDDDNDDGEDDLKPLLVDDNANNSNNNTTGINNTLSTIGTILSSTNNVNSIAAAANNNNSNNSNGGMRLRIKSSFADIDIEIPNGGCPLTTTVAQLKELVRNVLLEKERTNGNGNGNGNRHHNNEDRYLRIICKGRLLSPDESFLSEFKVCDEDVIHAVLAAAVVTSSSTRRQKQQRQTTNSDTSTSTTPHHQQQQRRRHNTNTRQRQRQHRGVGTVVGPGGRVTRVRTSNNNNNEGNDDDSNSDDENDDIEQGGGGGGDSSRRRRRRERRGFDQLRSGGLSRQEITAIRIYFNRQVDRFIIEQQEQQQQQQQPNTGSGDGDGEDVTMAATATTSNRFLHLDEPDLSRRRLLIEESWMTTQGPASEFRLNLNRNTLLRVAALSGEGGGGGLLRNITTTTTTGSNSGRQQGNMGNDRDFIWGFCLGFFVGIIGLVWVWVPTVPHKQKIGILTGISFQFFLNKDNMDAESEYSNINGGGVFENTYNDGD